MSEKSTTILEIPITKDLASLLGSQHQASEKAKELIILGLYQEDRISGFKAAQLLGLTRQGFISLLARKGMPYFRFTAQEWAEEVATVKSWNPRNA